MDSLKDIHASCESLKGQLNSIGERLDDLEKAVLLLDFLALGGGVREDKRRMREAPAMAGKEFA
jgi:hypothetical protein